MKKKKIAPKQKETSELVTLFKEHTKATEEREEKRLKEMKDMHKEKMSAMSKFLEINWTIPHRGAKSVLLSNGRENKMFVLKQTTLY